MVDIFRHLLVGRIVNLHDQSGRIGVAARCEVVVAPVHESLRHENRIESRREADDLAFESVGVSVAVDEDVEVDHPHETVADFRQRTALGKAKVIHCDIGTRQDDGHDMVARRVFPTALGRVDEMIGDALEEELRVEHVDPVDTHIGFHLIFCGGEGAHAGGKWLILHVVDLSGRESVGSSGDGVAHANLLADDDIVGLHEGVFRCEDGHHVAIELIAQQHDEHAKEVGKEKSHKLGYADMLTKQLPN